MRTVTGLFDDYSDARSAVSKLEAAGISSNDISIVSNKAGRIDRDSDVGEDAGDRRRHWRCRRRRWRPADRPGPDGHSGCRTGGCRRLACRDCGRGGRRRRRRRCRRRPDRCTHRLRRPDEAMLTSMPKVSAAAAAWSPRRSTTPAPPRPRLFSKVQTGSTPTRRSAYEGGLDPVRRCG